MGINSKFSAPNDTDLVFVVNGNTCRWLFHETDVCFQKMTLKARTASKNCVYDRLTAIACGERYSSRCMSLWALFGVFPRNYWFFFLWFLDVCLVIHISSSCSWTAQHNNFACSVSSEVVSTLILLCCLSVLNSWESCSPCGVLRSFLKKVHVPRLMQRSVSEAQSGEHITLLQRIENEGMDFGAHNVSSGSYWQIFSESKLSQLLAMKNHANVE